jgi:hypothetical protein
VGCNRARPESNPNLLVLIYLVHQFEDRKKESSLSATAFEDQFFDPRSMKE